MQGLSDLSGLGCLESDNSWLGDELGRQFRDFGQKVFQKKIQKNLT